jgi:hypothetical protein
MVLSLFTPGLNISVSLLYFSIVFPALRLSMPRALSAVAVWMKRGSPAARGM